MRTIKIYTVIFTLLFSLLSAKAHEEDFPNDPSLLALLEDEEHCSRSFSPYDAIINLGGNCQVAHQLKINGLRNYSLPFDYWNTCFDSLYLLLQHKFNNFFDKDNFTLVTTEHDKYILQTQYGVIMRHDFKLNQNFLDDYDQFKDKFERRIERFFNEIDTRNTILFIRNRVTKQQAQQLDALLLELCKHSNYTLVVLGNTPEYEHDWCLERIKNHYLRQPEPYVWKGDNDAWNELFTTLKLLNTAS